ncbi:hypothetical protein I546_7339 [Mycobacterium kansasii 732]|nr:hypothetical protein I546_7339 [Mycobacterium kansasii 732]
MGDRNAGVLASAQGCGNVATAATVVGNDNVVDAASAMAVGGDQCGDGGHGGG